MVQRNGGGIPDLGAPKTVRAGVSPQAFVRHVDADGLYEVAARQVMTPAGPQLVGIPSREQFCDLEELVTLVADEVMRRIIEAHGRGVL